MLKVKSCENKAMQSKDYKKKNKTIARSAIFFIRKRAERVI